MNTCIEVMLVAKIDGVAQVDLSAGVRYARGNPMCGQSDIDYPIWRGHAGQVLLSLIEMHAHGGVALAHEGDGSVVRYPYRGGRLRHA